MGYLMADFEIDRINQAVLEFLYEEQQSRPRRTGWSANQIAHHINQFEHGQVIMAVDLLRGEGWLQHVIVEKVKRYKLSSKGIAHFAPSVYQSKSYSPVHINGDGNIVVMGANLGVINQNTYHASVELDTLIAKLRADDIEPAQMRDAMAEVETIKAQLLHANPNQTIIRTAWAGLSVMATLSGAVQFAQYLPTAEHALVHWLGL